MICMCFVLVKNLDPTVVHPLLTPLSPMPPPPTHTHTSCIYTHTPTPIHKHIPFLQAPCLTVSRQDTQSLISLGNRRVSPLIISSLIKQFPRFWSFLVHTGFNMEELTSYRPSTREVDFFIPPAVEVELNKEIASQEEGEKT